MTINLIFFKLILIHTYLSPFYLGLFLKVWSPQKDLIYPLFSFSETATGSPAIDIKKEIGLFAIHWLPIFWQMLA